MAAPLHHRLWSSKALPTLRLCRASGVQNLFDGVEPDQASPAKSPTTSGQSRNLPRDECVPRLDMPRRLRGERQKGTPNWLGRSFTCPEEALPAQVISLTETRAALERAEATEEAAETAKIVRDLGAALLVARHGAHALRIRLGSHKISDTIADASTELVRSVDETFHLYEDLG
jgi:hypothetical protein